MHESLEITDSIYVHLKRDEQRERIARLSAQQVSMPDNEFEQYLMSLSKDAKIDTISKLAKSLAG